MRRIQKPPRHQRNNRKIKKTIDEKMNRKRDNNTNMDLAGLLNQRFPLGPHTSNGQITKMAKITKYQLYNEKK